MEDLVIESHTTSSNAWRNRSVLLTGHTGFKGGWLTLWLHQLGAKVHGYSLDPPTHPSFYDAAQISSALASDTRANLADLESLRAAFDQAQPEIVFHLAAQPLVRESYRYPLETFTTNIMGTAHVLEATRTTTSVRAVVIVTTDKVYENHGHSIPYREHDPLGGHDPYSASKAAVEIVASSYRTSFFSEPNGHPAHIATARAGNVIGGGDWSADRLVPDCLRSFAENEAVHLRHPHSVRPWQHVLEPLSGYLRLAEGLLEANAEQLSNAWNFGPNAVGEATVGDVADLTAKLWGESARIVHAPSVCNPPEAELLRLDSARARAELHWHPRWTLEHAIERTVAWHQSWIRGDNMNAISCEQILEYMTSSSA